MSKETVVIVNHNAGSPRYGPNLRTYYSAKYLVRRGYTVHVFSSSYSHKYVVLPSITGKVTEENIDGIHYHWIKTTPYKNLLTRIWSFWQFASQLFDAVVNNVSEMKAIICSSPPPVFVRICHQLAKRYNSRFLFDVRDLWPLTILEMKAASKYNPYVAYMGYLESFAYKNCDMVVSALPCAESYMLEHGLPQGHFLSIENGTEIDDLPLIDANEIPKDTREILERDHPFRVGYTGAFDRDNDLETLIDAAELLRDQEIQFVLVGKGKERERLENKISKLPNVYIVSPVQSNQIPWVLARFDVCFMGLKSKPIFKYGISMNKIFEYMRATRPIISAIDAGNDIVTKAKCGITVKPENTTAVAEAIKFFADMPSEKRQLMGEQGAAYMKANHTYDVLIYDWIKAIEGV